MNCSRILTACCSVLALAANARAQSAVDSACLSNLVDDAKPSTAYWRKRSQPELTKVLTGLERDEGWLAGVDRLFDLFSEDSSVFPLGDPQRASYARVLAALETYRANLIAASINKKSQGVAGAVTFRVAHRDGEYLLLNDSIVVPKDAKPDQARSLCGVAIAVDRQHQRFNAMARDESEKMLKERVERWNAFNTKGMTPYPWELIVNESVKWLGRKPLEPPKRQIVLFRPSGMFDVDADFKDRVSALTLEAGFLFYVTPGKYIGITGARVWPSSATPGWGAMVHLSLPWVKPVLVAGPVWRDTDGNGKTNVRWLVTLDALNLMQSSSGRLRDLAKKATMKLVM